MSDDDNQPSPLKTLFGRDALCDELERRCAGERAALWTLLGPPGVGKSSLLNVLATRLDAGMRRVVWLDLRGVQTAEALRRALLDALDAQASAPDVSPAERCAEILRAEPGVWLCMDNAEQLAGPLRELVDGLAPGCPSRLVATSRQRIGAAGEVVIEIAPLPVAAPDAPLEALETDDAISLMRARAQSAGASIGGRDALPALARLVAALDGLPLAIELAAPMLRLFRAEALLEQLQRSPQRQATHPRLEAVIEGSWALLTEWERAALSQLSVFARGAAPEAAEQVILLAPWPEAPPTAEVLLRLCDQSLVTLRDAPAPRVDMLVSIQRFARARMSAQDEADARRRHALALAARCGALDVESRWHPRLAGLSAERDDLWLAWQSAHELGLGLEVRVTLGLALGLLSLRAGDFAATRALLEPLEQAMADAGEPAASRARVWLLLVEAESAQWSHGHANPWIERGLQLADALPARLTFAFMRRQIERSIEGNELERASALELRAHELTWPLRDPAIEASLMYLRGVGQFFQDQAPAAIASFTEALRLWGPQDRPDEEGRLLAYRSALYHERGEAQAAVEDLRRARACFERVGDIAALAQTTRLLATVHVDSGAGEGGAEALDALRRLGDRYHITWARGWAALLAGMMYVDHGAWGEARRALEEALPHLERSAQRPFITVAHTYLCCAGLLGGDAALADAHMALAWGQREALRRPRGKQFLSSVRLAWLLGAQPREEALAEVNALCGDDARVTPSLFEGVSAALTALVRAAALRRRGKEAQAARHTQAALEQAASASAAHGAQLEQTIEARLCWRLLCRELPPAMQHRMALERRDAARQSLLIDAGALRAPGAQQWTDLAAESNQARLLRALIAAHSERPGEPTSAEALIEQVWPGERMTYESAKNRLHVAVTTLRKLGLRDVLQSAGGGYLLAPALRIIQG